MMEAIKAYEVDSAAASGRELNESEKAEITRPCKCFVSIFTFLPIVPNDLPTENSILLQY